MNYMFCKLFVFDKEENFNNLKSTLTKIKEPYRIVTNSSNLNNILKLNGFDSISIDELYPDKDPQTFELNKLVLKELQKYKKFFTNICFQNFDIFPSIQNQIIKELILIEKTKRILENKQNIIFIFKDFLFPLFIILKNALVRL